MTYSVKSTVILAKAETTPGTDAVPTAAANAVGFQVSDFSCDIEQRFAANEIATGQFGGADQIPYTRRGKVKFSVPFAASGTAGTAPAWKTLLQGCATAETSATIPTRLEYTPASAALKALSIWAYVNGVLEMFTYCAGNMKLSSKVGEVPTLQFEFTGLVTSVAAGSAPAATLTTWKRPLAFGPAACPLGLQLGATYTTGALSGGANYGLQEITLDLGNEIQDQELAGSETVNVVDWVPKVSLVADISGAPLAALYAAMDGGTTQSLGWVHGSVAGAKLLVHAGQLQVTSVKHQKNGKSFLASLELTALPSAAGNDAWRIVAL